MSVIAYECLSTLVNTFSAYLRLCIVSLCCFSFNGYVGNPQPTAPSRVPFLLSTLSPLPQRFSSGHSLQKYLSFPLRWYFLFIFFCHLAVFHWGLASQLPIFKALVGQRVVFFFLSGISATLELFLSAHTQTILFVTPSLWWNFLLINSAKQESKQQTSHFYIHESSALETSQCLFYTLTHDSLYLFSYNNSLSHLGCCWAGRIHEAPDAGLPGNFHTISR